jgi:hypothetical protein
MALAVRTVKGEVSGPLGSGKRHETEVAMTRYWKWGAAAILALAMFAPGASAQRLGFRGRFGFGPRVYGPTVFVAPGFYGPGWWAGPYWGSGYYGLGWYEPYGFVPGPNAGKVKVETKAKKDQVYVDGGYAGTVKELGSFPLKAGTHSIEVKSPDGNQTIYQEQVNVIAGKTVDIKP